VADASTYHVSKYGGSDKAKPTEVGFRL